jgi:hypothetical protein
MFSNLQGSWYREVQMCWAHGSTERNLKGGRMFLAETIGNRSFGSLGREREYDSVL